jgi:DNA-binding beta-propeller fold protein YncE
MPSFSIVRWLADKKLKSLILLSLIGFGCSGEDKNIMPAYPPIKNPLAIRISPRIWLIDTEQDVVVGEPILFDRFKELRGSFAGNALALPNGKLYVSNYSDNSETMVGSDVFVIDLTGWMVTNKYDIRAPNHILLAPNNLIYVTGASNTLIVIDPDKEEEIEKISCGEFGDSRSLSASTEAVYVTYAHGICVIDPRTNETIRQSPLFEQSIYGSAMISYSKIYILNLDSISILDPTTWQYTGQIKSLEGNLNNIAASGNEKAYITQCDTKGVMNSLIVIDTKTDMITKKIKVGNQCDSISISPFGKVYVTNRGDNTVSVIDVGTDQLIETIILP